MAPRDSSSGPLLTPHLGIVFALLVNNKQWPWNLECMVLYVCFYLVKSSCKVMSGNDSFFLLFFKQIDVSVISANLSTYVHFKVCSYTLYEMQYESLNLAKQKGGSWVYLVGSMRKGAHHCVKNSDKSLVKVK